MKSLYLRIWLTVVAALVLFAGATGWLWHRHIEQERARFESSVRDRIGAWAELVQRSLPGADASADVQTEALREWSVRLRLPLALSDAQGQRIGASESFLRREAEGNVAAVSVKLDDGRSLWIGRRGVRLPLPPGGVERPLAGLGGERMPPLGLGPDRSPPGPGADRPGPPPGGPGQANLLSRTFPFLWPDAGLPSALGPAVLVGLLLIAVAAGAYPVVRRLTRRLEALKLGVQAFGAGQLDQRVTPEGSDEVAAVATTFNQAADRIQALVRSHQSLLANASHELRSPLARLKMAVAMYGDAPDTMRASLHTEINTNIAELDALVEEVLLASRLDASRELERDDKVDLLGIAAEEAARVGGEASGETLLIGGSERLLRRAIRNLLENARRYGEHDIQALVSRGAAGTVEVRICDRGPGVPEGYRERIFEPFFRLPGHAEREGGVGLGLSLVRQIATRHGGSVRCEARVGGGSCFVLTLPA